MKTAWMLGAAWFAAAPVAAAPAVGIFGSEHDNYERFGAHVRLDPLWARAWGPWQVGLHPELELSRFRYTGGGRAPKQLDQAGAIALLRAVRGEGELRPYAEFGFGLALFSRTDLGNKEFSTRLQFAEHLGLGLEIGPRLSVGWRYSHHSNGDLELPNNGIDMHQLVVDLRF